MLFLGSGSAKKIPYKLIVTALSFYTILTHEKIYRNPVLLDSGETCIIICKAFIIQLCIVIYLYILSSLLFYNMLYAKPSFRKYHVNKTILPNPKVLYNTRSQNLFW